MPTDPRTLRIWLIGVLLLAAAVSVVAQKRDSAFIGWVSFALFLVGVALYFAWRRAVAARVFDREAKTSDETRARPDQ
jgi:uncharacterized membrane protein YfcA